MFHQQRKVGDFVIAFILDFCIDEVGGDDP
jgi:hypothetical protein